MKLVQVAEQKKRYYTKDFILGFNTGAKTQYEADSKERRGRWIETLFGWRCSVCGEEQDYSVYFKHCPNCGARMEGEKE